MTTPISTSENTINNGSDTPMIRCCDREELWPAEVHTCCKPGRQGRVGADAVTTWPHPGHTSEMASKGIIHTNNKKQPQRPQPERCWRGSGARLSTSSDIRINKGDLLRQELHAHLCNLIHLLAGFPITTLTSLYARLRWICVNQQRQFHDAVGHCASPSQSWTGYFGSAP